jgi:SSS family solute:Na+ symporter
LIAFALFKDMFVIGPDGSPTNGDIAFPTLILNLLPTGLGGPDDRCTTRRTYGRHGIGIQFNFDPGHARLLQKTRPDATEKQLVLIGRVATALMVVLGIAWVPFISRISGQLYIYLQSVQGYISPPIAACFILGILWPRLNAQGAISSLLTGFVLGTVRFVLELDYPGGVGAPGAIQGLIAMNFLHYAIVMFVACCAVLIGVSMVTPAPDRKKLAGLTFATVQ